MRQESVGKPVFAYVMIKSGEEGILRRDTPLVKYTHERFIKGDQDWIS